jgi:PAS domain S-box-containing protein
LDLENPDQLYMSREYKALFGYTDEEIPNTAEWSLANIFPEDKALTMEAFQSHLKDGTPYNVICRFKHKNGSTVWVRCRGKAIVNAEGKPMRMLGAHNDLTTLMEAQQRLKGKEAVLDLLCTTALDGYWDWNIKTGEDFLSARWKNALGYEEDELPNTVETWMNLLHPDDLPKATEAVRRHMEEGAPYSIVLRYRRKDGTLSHMLAQGVAQRGEGGEWVRMFGTHTDVSYLEEARAAHEANEAKTAFLATMSHDIRTPLNAVLGMAQALMATDLTEEQRDCAETLKNSGAHLLSLINDILDFSQIESGALRIAREEFCIQTTTRNVLDVLLLGAVQKDIRLAFRTHIAPGSAFVGDSERVGQILFNLVGNAQKFTKSGSVTVSLSEETRGDVDGVTLKVQDTVRCTDALVKKLSTWIS